MEKKLLCLLLSAGLLLTCGCAPAAAPLPAPQETQQLQPTQTLLPEETFPEGEEIAVPKAQNQRHYGIAEPENHSGIRGVTITPYVPKTPVEMNGIVPYGSYYAQRQVLGDMTGNHELASSLTVSDQTLIDSIPDGYDRDALIQWGKSPGLNVEVLHRHGFTGKGAVIAYIDQALPVHPEYNRESIHYIRLCSAKNSMHGPMVLSLLAGETTGTAPDAEVYYYGQDSNLGDQAVHAASLYAIIEQNKTLPEGEKITMVGFSDNIDPREKNMQALTDAVKACEDSGVMVFFCGDYDAGAFLPMTDRNNYRNIVADQYISGSGLYVPAGGRTGAYTLDDSQYLYFGSGGLSWTMPYMLGLYAIATEIDPTLTKAELLSLAKRTGNRNGPLNVVNPTGFIAQVLSDVGRTQEAQAILDEAACNLRYTYAVMNRSRMSQEDLRAVETYFARLTDTTVLVVDVRDGVTAEEIYRALQADAWERDGIVEGVQIFGTPELVSAFEVGYKVQMENAVDDAGTMYSDLFYGNFLNKADRLTGYNVLDHFAQGWDAELAPCWPVARLPLERGEYSAFFSKYHAFARETDLQQPELVNFSNPIFAQLDHSDDMSCFLLRAQKEFGVLNVPCRLYGNLDGDYPVTQEVLGGFLPEALAQENEKGICEFLINSHGQRDNIDQAIFQNGEEKRISFLNSKTIDAVLDGNAYYLDLWTCNNGYAMADNLTTAALKGRSVGVFAATHIISNNGVDCRADLQEMERGNFYFFYLNYLAALNHGMTRARAFCHAQRTYAEALMDYSRENVLGNGSYQFNLCNLLTYHNFGVLEPKTNGLVEGAAEAVSQEVRIQTVGKRPMAAKEAETWELSNAQLQENTLEDGDLTLYGGGFQKQPDGTYQYWLEYEGSPNLQIFAFSPPDGKAFLKYGRITEDTRKTFTFTVSVEELEEGLTVGFMMYSDDRRAFLPLPCPW